MFVLPLHYDSRECREYQEEVLSHDSYQEEGSGGGMEVHADYGSYSDPDNDLSFEQCKRFFEEKRNIWPKMIKPFDQVLLERQLLDCLGWAWSFFGCHVPDGLH